LKNHIRQSLLATTLVLFLASFSGLAQAHDSDRDGDEGHHHHHHCHHHENKLGITLEQHKQFEAIREEEHAQAKPLMKSMFEKHRELREAMNSANPNEDDVLAKAHELSQIHDQLMQLHIQTRFKMRAVLTPEQQQKMSQWKAERKADFDEHSEHRHSEWREDRDRSSDSDGDASGTNIKSSD